MDPGSSLLAPPDEPLAGAVVVGYDGSAGGRRAVRWAAQEAAERGSALQVVVASDDTGAPGAHRTATRLAPLRPDDAREALAEALLLAGAAWPEGVRGGLVRSGQPGGVLVDQSQSAQLVVVGCRGRTRLPASESSTSLITASRAGCPVVVVRGRPDPARGEAVLVGLDGSAFAPDPVRYAVVQARRAGAPLVLACGWTVGAGALPTVLRSSHERPGSLATAVRDVRRQAGEVLEHAVDLVERLEPGLEVRTELAEAGAERLLEGLSWGASLLVVGRGGTGPFPGLPIGAVTRSVLEHAGCPVAVVPTGEGLRN
jgi:nucleotide-binding universal stress UspA family protein